MVAFVADKGRKPIIERVPFFNPRIETSRLAFHQKSRNFYENKKGGAYPPPLTIFDYWRFAQKV